VDRANNPTYCGPPPPTKHAHTYTLPPKLNPKSYPSPHTTATRRPPGGGSGSRSCITRRLRPPHSGAPASRAGYAQSADTRSFGERWRAGASCSVQRLAGAGVRPGEQQERPCDSAQRSGPKRRQMALRLTAAGLLASQCCAACLFVLLACCGCYMRFTSTALCCCLLAGCAGFLAASAWLLKVR
jgi:hypothetical protein